MKLLHFADAHIDMANYGRHDPQTGLPLRVLDFLKSLDTIVDTAISEKVDMVIFAGDAYKDRSPAPTFQREWGRRLSGSRKRAFQPFYWSATTICHQQRDARMLSRNLILWKSRMCV